MSVNNITPAPSFRSHRRSHFILQTIRNYNIGLQDNDCILSPKSSLIFRDRPFNLQGGGLWFFVSFRFFFRTTRVRIFIFFVAQSAIFFFQNLILGYMTKTLNQIFFSSTKIRIFFSATLGIRLFLKKKPHTPPRS